LKQHGLVLSESDGPIISFLLGPNTNALRLENGFPGMLAGTPLVVTLEEVDPFLRAATHFIK